MAPSRRMAAAFLVVFLVIVVAAETATARDVVDDKLCLSPSRAFKGTCWKDSNCDTTCKTEKFTGGECKMEGIQRKCFCKKVC